MSEEIARCELCGEPMPPGETMFKHHGYSGDCPKPPLPREKTEVEHLRDLLIAFGKADIALDESEEEDGLSDYSLIDAHANAYDAIKAEAIRLAKESMAK